jgi:glutamine amidotransferase
MSDVILIDAGTGNLRSVQKALESLGARVLRTDDPKRLVDADRVVLPGVGAFGEFMRGLHRCGLHDAIKELAEQQIPMMGICVGMQALFEVGEEMGAHAGLGLLNGKVIRFDESLSVKIPHTGWNHLHVQKETSLFRGIQTGAYVYFNHTYYCQPEDSRYISATTSHGLMFACAIQHENVFGVQFHPEKSQTVGLRILKNFLEAV